MQERSAFAHRQSSGYQQREELITMNNFYSIRTYLACSLQRVFDDDLQLQGAPGHVADLQVGLVCQAVLNVHALHGRKLQTVTEVSFSQEFQSRVARRPCFAAAGNYLLHGVAYHFLQPLLASVSTYRSVVVYYGAAIVVAHAWHSRATFN